jgi:starch synthase (maltosyl-transferring)
MHSRSRSAALTNRRSELFAPKIYYFDALRAGSRASWSSHFARCRSLGFSHVLSSPLFAPGRAADLWLTADHERANPAIAGSLAADQLVAEFSQTCREHGLQLLLDIVFGRVAADAAVVASRPQWFAANDARAGRADPRSPHRTANAVAACWDDPDNAQHMADWWVDRLVRLADAGVAGFRCEDPGAVPPMLWRHIIASVKQKAPHCRLLAWTPGVDWQAVSALRDVGFDAAFSSVAWWDGRSSWFVEEHELLRRFGSIIGCPFPPRGSQPGGFGAAQPGGTQLRHLLRRAAATSHGLMIPMGIEFGLTRGMVGRGGAGDQIPADDSEAKYAAEIREATTLIDELRTLGIGGEMRLLTGAEHKVSALLRADAAAARDAKSATVVLINTDLNHEWPLPIALDPLPADAGMAAVARRSIATERDRHSPLAAGEVRLVMVHPTAPVKMRRAVPSVGKAAASPRIAIDNVAPSVDAGRFAAKRIVGEPISVEADVFSDGHDVLAAELIWRAADEQDWRRVRMQALPNDRWKAVFAPDRIGRYVFTIEAWWDRYGSFCHDLDIKHNAGLDVSVEILEGRRLLEETKERATSEQRGVIESAVDALAESAPEDGAPILLEDNLWEAMHEAEERLFFYRAEPALPLDVDRSEAAFAAWYELFPRSATDDPARHGTFDDVIRRVPAIQDMGFDVLYLPPIHPIGVTNRKGKNNALEVAPDDVGSPYAIGGSEGGHDALHPALGSFADFRRLRDAAAAHGMEIALDFAIQCSPDHPWLKAHPGWFKWRPDGTVRYAENPPKKYQDIVNVDFYAPNAVPELWQALRDIVLFWREEGIRIFRVDNPHTKPLPFWEWLIAQVRGQYPDVIFLSEAFTRPKMMYRLGKVGFTQSYTYFTWRNAKQELTDYFVELTTSEAKEFFRPHLFVNTPDINPYYLQTSGRPGFLVRAALAATLSGLWGIFSGFELCEAAPLPGREEYLDSDKYQIRVRHFDAPGNITAEIAKLNRIRKTNPALQSHLNTRFYPAHHDQVLLYGKMASDHGDMILVAVNLDPFHAHEATIEVPLWEWGKPDGAAVSVRDLMRDVDFVWHGKLQRIRLDPAELPFSIWRIAPGAGA